MQTTRTIYGAYLATCKALNKPFAALPNSTLNQKFNIHRNELPRSGEYPALKYVAIGNRGVSVDVTHDNTLVTKPIPRSPRYSSLYGFIPFVVREVGNDLSTSERSRYRLRVPVSVAGKDYISYYLRTFDSNEGNPTVELRNVTDGVITTNPFEPTPGDLAPVQPDISNVDINNPNGDYLVVSSKVSLVLNQVDIANIREACTILYGDVNRATISEVALVSGIDRTLQGVFGNTTSNYTEAVCTQINAFVYQLHPLNESSTGIEIKFDVGSSESLLVT